MAEEYVVMSDEHLLIFNKLVKDFPYEEIIYVRPCAAVTNATKFESAADAQMYLDRAVRIDKSINTLLKEAHEEADKNSDEIIKNAWSNTSRKKQEEMLDNLRKNKGDKAVEDWLNKYGPLNEETTNE